MVKYWHTKKDVTYTMYLGLHQFPDIYLRQISLTGIFILFDYIVHTHENEGGKKLTEPPYVRTVKKNQ